MKIATYSLIAIMFFLMSGCESVKKDNARSASGELILGKWQERVDIGEGEVWEFFEDSTLRVGSKGGGRSASGEWMILRDGRLKISVLTPQGTKTEISKPRFPGKNTLELYRHDRDKTPAGTLTRIIDN